MKLRKVFNIYWKFYVLSSSDLAFFKKQNRMLCPLNLGECSTVGECRKRTEKLLLSTFPRWNNDCLFCFPAQDSCSVLWLFLIGRALKGMHFAILCKRVAIPSGKKVAQTNPFQIQFFRLAKQISLDNIHLEKELI